MTEVVRDELLNDGAGYNAAYHFSDFERVALAAPAAIMTFISFFLLVFVFRFISWIVYSIACIWLAPSARRQSKRNAINGMPDETQGKCRWGGALIGVATGLILFFFLMVPVNGVFHAFHRIDNYQPSFATASVRGLDEDRHLISAMADVDENINDLSRGLSRGSFGLFSRYTGMQWASHGMLGYLLTIRPDGSTPNINLIGEVENFFMLYRDANAIYQNFVDDNGDSISTTEALENLSDAYWGGMERVVNRFFDISIINLMFRSIENAPGFIEDEGILDDLDMLVGDDGDTHRQEQFNDAFLDMLGDLTARSAREDLIQIVRQLRNVFEATDDGNSLYYDIRTVSDGDFLDGIGDLLDNNMDAMISLLDFFTYDSLFAEPLRFFVVFFLDEMVEENRDGYGNLNEVGRVLAMIRDSVEDGGRINWRAPLTSIRHAVNLLNLFDEGDFDMETMLETLLSGELLTSLMADSMLGPIVVDIMQDYISELLDFGTTFALDLNNTGGGFAYSLRAIEIMSRNLNSLYDYGTSGDDAEDLIDMLNPDDLRELADLPAGTVTITVDMEESELLSQLTDMFNGNAAEAQRILNNIFVVAPTG